MKKVLTSKTYTDKKRSSDFLNNPKSRDPIYYWETRNNSSNVAAILHPDNYVSSNRLKGLGKFEINDTNNNVAPRYPLGSNNCYCKKEKIRPKLLSRPKSCVFIEHQPQQYDNWLRKSLSEKQDRIQDQHCSCVRQREPGTSGWHSDENEEINSLHFTRDRLECERFREMQKNDMLEKAARFDEKHRKIASLYATEQNNVLPTKGVDSKPTDTECTTVGLNQFRKNHYFETHSTYKEGGNVPQHRCLHEYELDDRSVPKPVHYDVFGRSTCTICEKSTDHLGGDSLARLAYKSITDHNLERFKKAHQYDLRAKSVSLASGNKKLSLNLNDYCDLTASLDGVKPLYYRDSLALRHQRMKPQTK